MDTENELENIHITDTPTIDVGYDVNDRLLTATTVRQKKAIIKRYTEDMTKKLEKEFIYGETPYNPEDHWSKPMSVSVITKLLSEGMTLEQAYEYVGDTYNKTKDWIKTTKHKTVKPSFQVEVISEIESTQKESIVKLEEKDQYDRKALVASTTPNSQFNRIKKMLSTAERLDMLEKKVREIEVGNVVRDLFIENRISKLESSVENIVSVLLSDKPDLEKVGLLKEIGIYNKDIATLFGISERTLRRKMKENK